MRRLGAAGWGLAMCLSACAEAEAPSGALDAELLPTQRLDATGTSITLPSTPSGARDATLGDDARTATTDARPFAERDAESADLDAAMACANGAPAQVEVCNGEDDDCDGAYDEDFPGRSCCTADNQCAVGEVCGGAGECVSGGGGAGMNANAAPPAPLGTACASAVVVAGPGEYPSVTRSNGDNGGCLLFDTAGGEQAFTFRRAVDTEVTLTAVGDLLVNTVLYVRADCDDPTTEVACNDDADFLMFDATLTFTARAGETYTAFVDSWGAGGGFTLRVDERAVGGGGSPPDPPTAPPTEAPTTPPTVPPTEPGLAASCAAPIELRAPGQYLGSTAGRVSALAPRQCGLAGTAGELVYRLRVDAPSRVRFDTVGSSFDTVLTMRATCDDAQSEAECNDDTTGQASQITFRAEPARDYFVVVDGFGARAGDVALNYSVLEQGAAPVCGPGDAGCGAGERCFSFACGVIPGAACADALVLGVNQTLRGDNGGAPAVFASSCGGGDADALYAFMVPVDGQVTVDTNGSFFDTVLSVYEGCGAGAVEIACDDDAVGTTTSEVRFNAVAGRVYLVAVEGFRAAAGAFSVTLSQ